MILTISHLLRRQALQNPDAPAILAPGRKTLTYLPLLNQVLNTINQLRSLAVRQNDPVVIMLPNGPEMALAFLGVSCCAASAPLNPNYTQSELEFFLSDLNPRAILILEGMVTPAWRVAECMRIPIIKVVPEPDQPAGSFHFAATSPVHQMDVLETQAEDIALILHTSGTTSRPKMVPLSQVNLCSSAEHILQTLQLSPNDRCLNIMPLFHIHGLIAAVLASLAAGASIFCTPGFYAPRFFNWLSETSPTWYTAVPTMHQAILARAAEHTTTIANYPMRFIRSSSAFLPPQLIAQLECVFNAPVIEAYGMTEASHQMASNPLPPKVRKPGSVGLAAGPEMEVMDEDGAQILLPGQIGEIVIRGPNVTRGYLNNQESSEKAFTNGWFRTGDQGYMDAEGYFFLTGRLKEVINRGGEKISPREIDEVLLDHPAVLQVVTFAIPDAKLGEDIAAAVVLCQKGVKEKELREYAATRLAGFKVPRIIVIVDEIPKGPTGKFQRLGLAKLLGLDQEKQDNLQPDQRVSYTAPRTKTEQTLAAIWGQVLGRSLVGIYERWKDAGGDSMLALILLTQVNDMFSFDVSSIEFFDAETIAGQADLLDHMLPQHKD